MDYYRTSRLLRSGMEKLGMRSAPCPVAINSRPYQGRSQCLHCGYCRSGCRVDAKYQADRVLVASALETGRLELVTDALVKRIDMSDSAARVDGVTYLDLRTWREVQVHARVVIVCNNPIEIPRLFLNSANEFHPRGLGNQYDQVGRHFFCHLGTIGLGLTDQEVETSIGHNMGNIMSLDYCEDDPKQPYRGGFSLMSLNGAGAGVMAVDPLRRFMGAELKERMKQYNQSLLLVSFSEGLPSAENRITVDKTKLDAYGLPVAQVNYTLVDNDLKVFNAAIEKTEEVLRAAGSREVHVTTPAFEAHPMGTMRMGTDPRQSATDPYGRVHGMDNLFIGGAATFVTGSSVNPTLTLHALALRTAEHLVQSQAHSS
jgi:choline dehydrogenase-like flavoprotein